MAKNRINDYLKVYMIGKIGKSDWRHDIFPDLRLAKIRNAQYKKIPKRNGLVYSGPFFESCDHGCAHGDSEHGLGLNSRGCFVESVTPRRKAFKSCIKGIDAADFVFCWIDQPTAFGSLVEIGYAFSRMKPIFIATPFDASFLQDFWFSFQCANKVHQSASHIDAWLQFEKWIGKKVISDRKDRGYSPVTEPQATYIIGLIQRSTQFRLKSEEKIRELDRVTASQIIDGLKHGVDVSEFYDEYIEKV